MLTGRLFQIVTTTIFTFFFLIKLSQSDVFAMSCMLNTGGTSFNTGDTIVVTSFAPYTFLGTNYNILLEDPLAVNLPIPISSFVPVAQISFSNSIFLDETVIPTGTYDIAIVSEVNPPNSAVCNLADGSRNSITITNTGPVPPTPTPVPSSCGNTICQPSLGENCVTCAVDCSCATTCNFAGVNYAPGAVRHDCGSGSGFGACSPPAIDACLGVPFVCNLDGTWSFGIPGGAAECFVLCKACLSPPGAKGRNPCDTNGDGIPDNCPTALGLLPIQPGSFAQRVLQIGLGIAGGIALILMVIGSVRVLTSSGDQQRLNGGRDMIVAAVSGLLFMIFAVLILRFIGFNIIGL